MPVTDTLWYLHQSTSWANQWHFCIVFSCAFSSITIAYKTRYPVLVTWSMSLDVSSALSSRLVIRALLPLCFRKFFLMLIQRYCQRRQSPFFPSFFFSPFPILSLPLPLQFPLLLYLGPVLTKFLNYLSVERMGPSLLISTHRSSSMIAPSVFWTLGCAIILFMLHQETLPFFTAELHNKACFSRLKLLYAFLLSTSLDVLQLWMRIAAVKFVEISSFFATESS